MKAVYALYENGDAAQRAVNGLRAAGYQIIERQDASTGAIDAGVSEFTRLLGDGASAGVIYVCGQAEAFFESSVKGWLDLVCRAAVPPRPQPGFPFRLSLPPLAEDMP